MQVKVTNTGTRPGQEIVQVFLSDLYASVTPCNRRLKRFRKIALAAGERKVLSFSLNEKDFAFIDRENKPAVEAGEFRVSVGGLNAGFFLRGEQTETLPKVQQYRAPTKSQ